MAGPGKDSPEYRVWSKMAYEPQILDEVNQTCLAWKMDIDRTVKLHALNAFTNRWNESLPIVVVRTSPDCCISAKG